MQSAQLWKRKKRKKGRKCAACFFFWFFLAFFVRLLSPLQCCSQMLHQDSEAGEWLISHRAQWPICFRFFSLNFNPGVNYWKSGLTTLISIIAEEVGINVEGVQVAKSINVQGGWKQFKKSRNVEGGNVHCAWRVFFFSKSVSMTSRLLERWDHLEILMWS